MLRISTNIILFLSLLSCSLWLHHRHLVVSAENRALKYAKVKSIKKGKKIAKKFTPNPSGTFPPSLVEELDANASQILIAAAVEAYTFFYPLLVVNYTAIAAEKSLPDYYRVGQNSGELLPFFNTIDNNPNTVNANFTTVVNPNADTLYSQAWIDINDEAIVLTLPKVETNWTRFFVAQLQDMWSNTFANPGTRTMIPDGGGDYVGFTDFVLCLAGSGQCDDLDVNDVSLPTKPYKINVPTSYIWMITRTQVLKEDLLNERVNLYAFQEQYKLTNLSTWRVGGDALDVLNVSSISDPTAPSPNNITEALTGCDYFNNATNIWQYNQNTEITDRMNKTLALLGMRPGEPVSCTGAIGVALEAPIQFWDGELAALGIENLCKAGAGPGCVKKAGPYDWDGLKSIGNYSTDYETRAVVASVGLGGNLNEDATYYLAPVPGTALFNGSYIISFPEPPPAQAFWSITVYSESKFLIAAPEGYANPTLGVCIINNMNVDIKKEADNSTINIYLQPNDPGDDKNWLCTPQNTSQVYQMTFRGYWPDNSIVNFSYPMAGIYTTLNELPCLPDPGTATI